METMKTLYFMLNQNCVKSTDKKTRHIKRWHVITHPYLNFNGGSVKPS